MRAHLPRVIGEQRLPRGFVGRLERLEVRVERRLGVDDDVLAAGQVDDDVGPHAAVAVGAGERLLLVEVAVLDHAGELDDALELQLAPAAADAGALQRVDQPRRFAAQVAAHRVERAQPLHERRARLDAAALGILDLAIDLLERSWPAARAGRRWLSCGRRCRPSPRMRASRSRDSARCRNAWLFDLSASADIA